MLVGDGKRSFINEHVQSYTLNFNAALQFQDFHCIFFFYPKLCLYCKNCNVTASSFIPLTIKPTRDLTSVEICSLKENFIIILSIPSQSNPRHLYRSDLAEYLWKLHRSYCGSFPLLISLTAVSYFCLPLFQAAKRKKQTLKSMRVPLFPKLILGPALLIVMGTGLDEEQQQ